MSRSLKELNKLWMKKIIAQRRPVVNPPATSDVSLIGEETSEGGSAAATVSAPIGSVVMGNPDPPLALEVVGSEEAAKEEVVPIPISVAVEDAMVPLLPAAPLGLEPSGEDQLCERSESPDALGRAEEVDASIPSILSPARICQDGAGKVEEVLSLVAEPEAAEAPRAPRPLVEEQTDLSPVGLASRSSTPVGDESSSRKRRRESEPCLPPPLLPSPITIDPSSAPPSSGSCIPELGDLQRFALLLGEHSLSPVRRALMERESPCMRMKAALKALSEVHYYVADFATRASQNSSLELSCALEKIEQFADIEKQHKASIDLLGRQCDETNAALAECEDRVARREADLQEVEKRLIEKERLCNRLSRSCSYAEDEVRHLRDAWRRHQELEHPEPRRGRSTEGSSRLKTVHPQRMSSSVRPDHHSEERIRAKGKKLIDEAIRAAFSAGRSSDPNAKTIARDEVLKNISADFQSRFDNL